MQARVLNVGTVENLASVAHAFLRGVSRLIGVPQRGRLPVGEGPTRTVDVRFHSYRAASLGNQASRNLVTKSTLGGRATLQAVTRVKLEQASKATMWTPTRPMSGEGRVDWEEPGAGARNAITVRTSRATGVVSTACKEGSLRQWGRLGMVGESRCPERHLWDGGPSGRRRGPDVPEKPGNAGGGKGACFWCA